MKWNSQKLKTTKTRLKLITQEKKFKGDKTTEERIINCKVRETTQNTSWKGKIMVNF